MECGEKNRQKNPTWWFIPLSKWVITLVINGISGVSPLITRVITHLLSGMNHQVWFRKDGLFCIGRVAWPVSIGCIPVSKWTMGLFGRIFLGHNFFWLTPPGWVFENHPKKVTNRLQDLCGLGVKGIFQETLVLIELYIYSHESEGVTSLNKCCIQCTSAEFYCILQSFFVRSNTWGVPFILTGSIAIVLGPLYPNIW